MPRLCSVRMVSPSKCTARAVGHISASFSNPIAVRPARPQQRERDGSDRPSADDDDIDVDVHKHSFVSSTFRIG